MGASAAALAVLSASPAAAQTWTGATSNDWTVGSNWSGGAVPGAGGTVLINTVSSPVLGLNGPAGGTTGSFTIGSPGASTLTIENGSTLTSTGTINIGAQPTGTAAVTVTGAGSQWIANGALFVASAGTGILNIEDGATVIATNSVRLGGAPGHGPAFLNISDGTLETARLSLTAGAQANFDNAIFRATAANAAWITNLGTLNIEAGVTIDSNGFAIGTAAGFEGVGGLTKIGAAASALKKADFKISVKAWTSGAFGSSGDDRAPCSTRGADPMNEANHHKHRKVETSGPDWRHIHHSPLFWLGVVLFVAAIGIYVWSDDLAWRPRIEHH